MENINVITHYGAQPIGVSSGMYVKMDNGMSLEETMRISSEDIITIADNTITVVGDGYTKTVQISDDGSEISETLSYGANDLQTKYIHISDSAITIDEIAPNISGGDGE